MTAASLCDRNVEECIVTGYGLAHRLYSDIYKDCIARKGSKLMDFRK